MSPDTDDPEPGSSLLPGPLGRSFLAKFVLVLSLGVLLVGGVSAYTYTETSDQLTEETETEYIGVAEQTAQQIENWQNSRADTTRRLSRFEAIQSGNQTRIQSFLESERSRLPEDVYRVHYVNLDESQVVASSDRAKEGETLLTREAPWQNDDISYGQNGVFVSQADEINRRSLVSFVSPVGTSESGDQLVVVMQVNFDTLAEDLSTQEGSFTQVLDTQGRIVAGTRQGSAIDRNDGVLRQYVTEGNATLLDNGAAGETGFLQDPAKNGELGEPHVAAYAPVEGTDWVVATHVPSATAFQLRDSLTQSLGVLVAAVLFGFVFLAVTFGRGTVNALNDLTAKARELEAGNLGVDLTPDRGDEFGTLTAAFGNMRDSLQQQIEAAERARKEAEVSRAEAMEMNEHLKERTEEYSEVMQRCAAGDLTERMESHGEQESMDRIAEEFNEMMEELENTVGQLKSYVDEVEEAGSEVERSAATVREASEEMADSVQRIASDAESQRQRLDELSATMADIADELAAADDEGAVEAQLERIDDVAAALTDAAELSEQARAETETVSAAAQEQAAELNQMSERANYLKRYAQPLRDILDRFETEDEHEFVFSVGPGSGPSTADSAED